ncbi:MAG: Alpha/Beta hydrolase protein [Monoraphidium minutum]|nr:MAG: Alpha/Beta hydrolase protein [Monoraphidium minutum]
MAVSFAREVAAGFMAAVMEEREPMERLKKAGQLGGAVVAEMAAGLALAPHLGRAVRVHRSLPVAGTAAADESDGGPYGVVLHPSIPYGPAHRQLLDVYVPFPIYRARRPRRPPAAAAGSEGVGGGGGVDGGGGAEAPVLFFVHGGIWATGDRFHFAPMAARLAQAGLVVVVISYTLYPEAMADVMAAEALRALMWTLSHARAFGGDPSRLAVAGHSAGGHLGALAVMMLSALRRDELEERRRGGGGSALTPAAEPGARQQAAGGGWGAGGGDPLWAPGPALCLPRVALFVGMSGVYHVARHHEYEASRCG